jgi:hypothetical protein
MNEMTMTKWAVCICAALIASGGAPVRGQQNARDPIIGAWTLNLAQSKFPPGMPGMPKAQTEVYRESSPARIELAFSRVLVDGSAMNLTIVWPASGGAVQYVQGTPTPGETLVETRLAPGDWLVTYMREGAQYATMRKVVSADGRTLRQTYTTVLQGKPIEIVAVMDRQ